MWSQIHSTSTILPSNPSPVVRRRHRMLTSGTASKERSPATGFRRSRILARRAMPGGEPTARKRSNTTSERSLCGPITRRAHNNIGVIQQERGDLVGAARAFQKAIESDPLFGLAWFNRGNYLREENRLSDAIAHYCRALELMPADAETRINLATVLREVRQFDASLGLLDEIPSTSPQWPKAEFNRSLIYFLRGEWGRGWDAYEAQTGDRARCAGNRRIAAGTGHRLAGDRFCCWRSKGLAIR